MLRLDRITKIFNKGKKNEFKALDNVSLDFSDRGLVFIVGKSGCGKTTLLNIIGKLDTPTSGSVSVENKDAFTEKEADDYRNQYIGIIFQEFNLLQDFTAAENIRLAREINRESMSDAEVENLLKMTGLDGQGGQRVNLLSGGQRQRVAIARTLAKNPKIILADEPTGNLDKSNAKAIMETLSELSRERLVIVITHDMESAEHYADRIISMQDGRIVSDSVKNTEYKGAVYADGGKLYIADDTAVDESILEELNAHTNAEVILSGEKKFMPANGIEISKSEYSAHRPTVLPTKAVAKLSFSKIKNHKFKFLISLLLIVVSLTVFGISGIIAGYDVGAVSAENFERFSEPGVLIQKAENIPPFGYVDRFYGRMMFDDDYEKLMENKNIESLDKFYFLAHWNFDFSKVDSGNSKIQATFGGLIETDESKLVNYGYKMLAGKFPESSVRDADNRLHLAITDYSAYVMGISLDATSYPMTVSLPSQEIVVEGVLETDFKDYKDVILKRDEDLSDEQLTTVFQRINCFWTAFYGAYGVSENMFLDTVDFGGQRMNVSYWEKTADKITADGKASPDIVLANGKNAVGELADDEILLSEIEFSRYYSEKFDPSKKYAPYVYQIEYGTQKITLGEYKVVGVVGNISKEITDYFMYTEIVVMTDASFKKTLEKSSLLVGYYAPLPESFSARAELINFLDANFYFHYSAMSDVIYSIYNDFSVYRTVFLYLAIVLAVAGALFIVDFMMGNIKDRQNEIGILRAMGVRGKDISKMFFMQAGIVFVLGAILAGAFIIGLTELLNFMLYDGFLAKLSTYLIDYVPLLTLTVLPFVLTLSVLLGVLVVATILPTLRLTRMKPIDCIKER